MASKRASIIVLSIGLSLCMLLLPVGTSMDVHASSLDAVAAKSLVAAGRPMPAMIDAAAVQATTLRSALSAGTCPTYYTIRRGDTLSSIARRCGVSVSTLMRLNGLRSDRIYAGRVLLTRSTRAVVIRPTYSIRFPTRLQLQAPDKISTPVPEPVLVEELAPTPTPCIESPISHF